MEPVNSLADWTRTAAALLGAEPPSPTARDVSSRPELAATYGLPPQVAALAGATQSILRIGHSREQMLTAWQFDTLRGSDFSHQVDVQHLGVIALRVQVPDADAAMTRLERAAIPPVAKVERRRLRPYGEIRGAVVRSGGGSGLLLEAVEVDAARLDRAQP